MKRALFLLSVIAMFAGCQTTRLDPDPSMLRVGVTPQFDQFAYRTIARFEQVVSPGLTAVLARIELPRRLVERLQRRANVLGIVAYGLHCPG